MSDQASPFRADLLAGKVALVTGGATGLGLEVAGLLGTHGCKRAEIDVMLLSTRAFAAKRWFGR
ncbi:hypothetical protein ORI20_17810 [Mycobacterium sp. CVI_P3]|uniref:Oxidoreductase n=1 Tax=Mycobacterium pinniadriaticum TaxID=2994102 RepID=A0ABT3SI82_9MYCO|nr:hypothetical protein [Mycobacterium pinniadriaticum]MCX2932133.1 hypothetical protein [Mycobacterium pinniadriaticum]MCX2938557.1 hypothetical protein [Mycobacterium pinniadriaticum]